MTYIDNNTCAWIFFLGLAFGALVFVLLRPYLVRRYAFDEQTKIGTVGVFAVWLAFGAVFVLSPSLVAKELSFFFFGAGGGFFGLMRFIAHWRKPP